MRAATLFSGIGAPEAAMPGWDWLWHAEIEPFPAAVLAARHPGSANLGDVLAAGFDERAKSFGPVDVLVGGPPCQAFSIAGNRNSLADPRGNLSLRWAQIIHAVDPVWAVTENVPGWLNTPDNAFGHFLGALVGADDPLPAPGGQGWPRAGMAAGPLARACWRVLDAQYFDLAQRRERVFIVSSARDWTDPSQILFEPAGVRRDTPSRGEARERVARPLTASPGGSGRHGCTADTADDLIAHCLAGRHNQTRGGDLDTYIPVAADVAPPITSNPYGDHESREGLLVAAYGGNDTRGPIEVSTALNAHGGPHGRLDFESETFVAQEVVAYDIHGVPATSGATETDVHTPLRARPPGGSEASTTTVVAYQCQGSNVGEAGTLRGGNGHLTGGVPFVATAIPILESGKRTGASSTSRKAGDGLGRDGDPMFTLGTDSRHAVAFHENQRAEVTLNDTAGSLKTGGGKPGQGYPAVFLHANKGRPDGRKSAHEPMVSVKDVVPTLDTDGHAGSAVAVDLQNCALGGEVSGTLDTTRPTRGGGQAVMNAAIRRLLPAECEKLMGFEPGYTAITYRGKEAADGNRYRALGNSMAVPVVRWILGRIEQVGRDLRSCQTPANQISQDSRQLALGSDGQERARRAS